VGASGISLVRSREKVDEIQKGRVPKGGAGRPVEGFKGQKKKKNANIGWELLELRRNKETI